MKLRVETRQSVDARENVDKIALKTKANAKKENQEKRKRFSLWLLSWSDHNKPEDELKNASLWEKELNQNKLPEILLSSFEKHAQGATGPTPLIGSLQSPASEPRRSSTNFKDRENSELGTRFTTVTEWSWGKFLLKKPIYM